MFEMRGDPGSSLMECAQIEAIFMTDVFPFPLLFSCILSRRLHTGDYPPTDQHRHARPLRYAGLLFEHAEERNSVTSS